MSNHAVSSNNKSVEAANELCKSPNYTLDKVVVGLKGKNGFQNFGRGTVMGHSDLDNVEVAVLENNHEDTDFIPTNSEPSIPLETGGCFPKSREGSFSSVSTISATTDAANSLNEESFADSKSDTGAIYLSSKSDELRSCASENDMASWLSPLHSLFISERGLSSFVKDKSHVSGSTAGSTGLILEHRPFNLPKKCKKEEIQHEKLYKKLLENIKKKEVSEGKNNKKKLESKLKEEEMVLSKSKIWNCIILPNWESQRATKKTQELWWSGIPTSVRGVVWQLAIENNLNITKELYAILIDRLNDQTNFRNSCIEDRAVLNLAQIKLDISRTFPHLSIFQEGGPYHELLYQLIGAYVCYRPDIGYVQGMSFLAAMLLLNCDVVDAFCCFANLLNKPLLRAFFCLDHPTMKAYYLVYETLLQENLPSLWRHFRSLQLTPDLYLVDWIYTLYSRSLPLDLACRVWDVFLRDGDPFVIQVALGILHLFHEELLAVNDFISAAQFLTKLPDNISSLALFDSIADIRLHVGKQKFSELVQDKMCHLAPP